MSTEVILPRFNMDMESGTILRWLQKEGDQVREGDPLCEVETDKVTMEVEAPSTGILCALRAAEGETVPVTSILGFIASNVEEADRIRAQGKEPPSRVQTAVPQSVHSSTTPIASEPTGDRVDEASGRLRASPAVRRRARENGIDLTPLADEHGRVTRAVLENAIKERAPSESPAATEPVEAARTVPMTRPSGGPLPSTRRAIAARMARAHEIPDITVEVEVRVRRWLAWRDQFRGEERPSITATLAAAVAHALSEHPLLNSTFEDEQVIQHDTVNLAIAVARPIGLIAPVLKELDRMKLSEISRRSRELIDRARANRVTLDDVSGGTFTISSLGEVGIDRFRALINPPQVAILAVGRIADRVVPIDGAIGIEPTMQLSLTCDHRVVDGEPAGRFLVRLKELLEDPAWMAAV